ncbi:MULTISPECIES: PLP-dependent aminotransferase family protein [Acinetobacter]|uniref:MocR-like pyridoxine biosynthesis transcription factor PdxR n=1 Tax=Acinetobacter TaxID=469 RepID=UPI000C3D96BD|nr:PLP-dependent aminotransferase family protein [Acinetobacter sp.]MBC68650.1 GntR family transcriptional regulator [Acinetobacter sp.]MBT50147.1 GntR family transcriptional regulator [Acinetobacter sp.]
MTNSLAPQVWEALFADTANSGLNLQGRICRMMFTALVRGYLKPGMAVPSSRYLADQLRLGRNTVTIAYQQLVAERILESRQRSGHFVHPSFQMDSSESKTVTTTSKPTSWTSRFQLRPSTQRHLTKPIDWMDYAYPFIYGQPDVESFPVSAWRECSIKALSAKDASIWARDITQQGDDLYLVNAIRQHILPTRGILAQENEILLTVGSQHALYMLARLLMHREHVVGVENPGYPDARNIFMLHTEHVVPLAVDQEGIALSDAIGCDYIYVTPGRHCPTGVTLSPTRRNKLLQLAEQQDSIIIEDEYDAQVLVQNTTIPALKSLDRHGRVVYIGSLSKPLAPGLRLGYIVAAPELIAELRHLRRLMLRHPNLFNQRVFALFIDQGYYHAMLRRQFQLHRQRGEQLIAALAHYFPNWKIYPLNGGAACWIDTQSDMDCQVLAKYAANVGVFIEAGQPFFFDENQHRQFLRLGIGSISVEKITEGIQFLAHAVAEYQKYNAVTI